MAIGRAGYWSAMAVLLPAFGLPALTFAAVEARRVDFGTLQDGTRTRERVRSLEVVTQMAGQQHRHAVRLEAGYETPGAGKPYEGTAHPAFWIGSSSATTTSVTPAAGGAAKALKAGNPGGSFAASL